MEVNKNQKSAWLYLLPTLILLAVFTVYPLFKTIFMAFCEKYNYIKDTWESFGIDNFRVVLTGGKFVKYLKNTVIIVFISVPVSIILSLLIAVGLNSIKKFTKIYQTIFFMPYVTNSIAIGMVFSVMFSQDNSIVNTLLNALNITPVNWMGGSSSYGGATYWSQMGVLLIYIVWHSLPFKILVLLSGLQGIDKQYYQAAQIDCATRGTILRKITMPLLSPQIAFLTTTSFIGAFKEYSSVIGLFGDKEGATGAGPTPMRTIVGFIYASLQDDQIGAVGYACAGAVLLFLIIMVFTLLKEVVAKQQVHY